MPIRIWVVAAAYVFVATREATTLYTKQTTVPWFKEIINETLYNPSPLSSVSNAPNKTDYFFFTWLRREGKNLRYLCALKRCFPLHPTDNILLCIVLHVAAYAYSYFRPYESFQYFYVNRRRPYTYVLAQLSMPNLYGLVCTTMMLADLGESVIKQHASMHLFWILYVGIPVVAVLVMQQFDGYVQMGGGRAGLLALAVFASQTAKQQQRFLFLGQFPVSAYGLVGIEVMWILMEHFTSARLVECIIIILLGVGFANL